MEEIYLNSIKVVCDKATWTIMPNAEKLKAYPLKSGTR